MVAPALWPLAVIIFSIVVWAENVLDGEIIWFTPIKFAMLAMWAWIIFGSYRPDILFKWAWERGPIKLHPNCADSFQQGLEKVRRVVGKDVRERKAD